MLILSGKRCPISGPMEAKTLRPRRTSYPKSLLMSSSVILSSALIGSPLCLLRCSKNSLTFPGAYLIASPSEYLMREISAPYEGPLISPVSVSSWFSSSLSNLSSTVCRLPYSMHSLAIGLLLILE